MDLQDNNMHSFELYMDEIAYGDFAKLLKVCHKGTESSVDAGFLCVINATGVACEALKNLVIPGITCFAVLDNKLTDTDTNYFLERSELGIKASEACCLAMRELNNEVIGTSIDNTLESLLESNPKYFCRYDLVIASNLKENEIIMLSKRLYELGVPLIYVRALGFMGSIHVQMKDRFNIFKTKQLYDLRLHELFPSLRDFIENTPITEGSNWLLKMYHYLRDWQASEPGRSYRLPSSEEEMEDMCMLVVENFYGLQSLTSEEEDDSEQETLRNNMLATLKESFNKCLVLDGRPPENLLQLFEACNNLDDEAQKEPFWILLKAVRQFVEEEGNGFLPLSGCLPEECEQSEILEDIHEIYRLKALQDANWIYEKCKKALLEFGRPLVLIQMPMIQTVIANLPYMGFDKCTPIFEEYERTPNHLHLLPRITEQNLQAVDEDDEQSEEVRAIQNYIAFRAIERYCQLYGEQPKDGDTANNLIKFKAIVKDLQEEWSIDDRVAINTELINDICDYGSVEMETISADVGAMASDMAVKVLTCQSVNLEDTFFFDGVADETTKMTF